MDLPVAKLHRFAHKKSHFHFASLTLIIESPLLFASFATLNCMVLWCKCLGVFAAHPHPSVCAANKYRVWMSGYGEKKRTYEEQGAGNGSENCGGAIAMLELHTSVYYGETVRNIYIKTHRQMFG